MLPNRPLTSLCFLLLALQLASARAEDAQPILQVIRLKPGESKSVEVCLPREQFKPAGSSGRASFGVDFLPEKNGGEFVAIAQGKPVNGQHFKAGPYSLMEGVVLRWNNNKPEIEFEASKNSKPGQKDVRITYSNFGGKVHTAGFRIVVAAEQ